ncbi:uncharacterized protein [Ptychodera flava]|uniref:uncharacterized protein n=1 Tax=Ptychodera flava TaxID=63121 RepID=UPI00396A4A9D
MVSGELQYTTTLSAELDFSDCLRLGLRGYNKAGLSTTVHREIKDCSVVGHITKNIVIDAVGEYDDEIDDVRDVHLSADSEWPASDAEYTRSKSKLSAVWPSLGHGNYSWKVISDQTLARYAYQKPVQHIDYKSYPSSSPHVIAYGKSQSQYINVGGLELQHGWRYYICIHANETVTYRANIEVILPQVSACSDGIVADHTPPATGIVKIGLDGQQYQTSTSELIVHWSGFYDVDEHGRSSHSSGIKTYEIAIGSSPGGIDARDYQSVGMLNRIVVTDLYLQGGLTYFATVRATDYVGLRSEAVSNGITVDVTPPMTSEESLELGGHFLTSISSITASWTGLFTDVESGIVEYEWCVGSKSWHSDVYACTVTDQEESILSDDDDLELLEGHVYYVMVKAYNNAGLSSAIASSGMLVDASSPVGGFVYDGDDKNTDKDHQTHLDSLAAHWYGFYDPHSPVSGYSWKIGSCSECDDVLSEEDVGLSLEMKASNLNLEPGVRYYTTVTACNAAGLCTTVTSDGIIPDNSPPIAGKVYDGVSHGDIAFQSSRTSLSAHWYNFHDPHSQLSHYELRAGTTPGGDDILPRTRLHLTEKAYISQLPNQLRIATPIYVTVTAFNKAGLLIEKSSNGMMVDDTPPTLKKKPTYDSSMGSVYNGTQVWSGLLSVSWEFHDSESPIVSQLLSVSTHRQSDLNVSPVKVQGNVHQYTFTNLSLYDGNTYYVHVIACNAAKLCASCDTDDILIDSSPPTVGTFAMETDHAAGLTRHREGWMTYHQSQGQNSANVKLAWLGFADIHTGIRHYNVGIGSRYASWDMTWYTTVQVQHSNGSSHFDEGSIQTATVDINRDLIPGEHIYCTLWAVNKVGLQSYEAHETFVVTKSNDQSGILSLLRRCDIQTCQGDCTCALQNTPCDFTPENCNDVTGNNQYQQVQVFDVIDYRDVELIGDAFEDVNFTASRCALAARWRASNNGISIQRYEWSVGSKGDAPGTGLLNPAFDRIWHDAGLNTFVVFTARDIFLNTKLEYVFYVKSWYDETEYAVFASDGIRSDGTPPGVSTSRKVKDVLDLDTLVDTDYSSSTSSIGVSWKSIFSEADSEIRYFSVSIGTHVGGEDIQSFGENIVASNEFEVKLDGLTLQPGIKYYSNVKAVNSAGLVSIASSDGFLVDAAPPEIGVVHDGLGIHDSDYQNSSTIVAASWHGFSDLQSSIHHYMWCVGTTPGAEDVLPCRDVGLHLSIATISERGLSSGQSYFSKVMAVDAAGLQSAPAISNGITVDTTVPEAVKKVNDHTNLIGNPSFEEVETEDGETDCTNPEIFICLPAVWQVQGTGHVTRGSNVSSNAGNAFMNIYGSVSQTVETAVGGKYRVSFYASHLPVSETSLVSQQGYIYLPGLHRVFRLFKRRTRAAQLDWYEHVYYFTAASELSNVTIGSFGDKSGIAIDEVQLFLTSEQEGTPSTSDPIQKHLRTDGKEFSLHASWDITDPESPIVNYMVAIGTVKGGTQLQDFRSVGRSTQVFIDDLLLTSGLPIYITVVAKNAADLTAVFYSEPIMVDITPPQLCCVGDGPNEDEDLTHQTSSVISVHWRVSDPESGIEYCEWAIGRAPSSSTLLPYTRTSTHYSASVDLENHVHHADTVYCSIRCKNSVGLFSYGVSRGVTLVKEAPHSHDATLRVVTSSPTVYDARENHQTKVNSITIAWDGFSDLSGISHFECKLLGDTKEATQAWRSVGVAGETTAVMTGLSLKSYKTYQVQLRAVNYGGLKSEPTTSDVIIETCPPYRTGHDLLYSWLSESVVHLDWSKLFISNSSLTYELSVGSTLGGGNILKWYETRIPSFQFNEVDLSIRYFVTIVAVNEAGLFEIYNTDFFPKHN